MDAWKGRMFATLAALAIAGLMLGPARTGWNAAEPIKIGEVGPLSPPGGYEDGKLMLDAAKLAEEEINAAGGVLGRPIKVIEADTRGKPEEGTAAAERLITQEKVVAIFGEFHSGVFLAEMEVAHKNGIPIMAVDVWANKITAKGYPEVFRVAPAQAIIANRYADWIAAAGFKNVLVMYEKTDGGEGHRDVLLAGLKRHGVKYDVVGVDLNQTEFTAQLQRLLAHEPPYDLLAAAYSEAGLYPLVSQAKTIGFAPTAKTGMYNSGGPATTEAFWKNVERQDQGVRCGVRKEIQDVDHAAVDGELRRAVRLGGRDQPRRQHGRQGHHRRARDLEVGRHARAVRVLDEPRPGLDVPSVRRGAALPAPVRQGGAEAGRRAGDLAAESGDRALRVQEAPVRAVAA